MIEETRKIKGSHLKTIRQYCGMTQTEFGEALGEYGITSRDGSLPGKDEKIIASWESGRRDIPTKVLKAIQKNILYEGYPIRWEYLIGQDEFITIMECMPQSDEMLSIVKHSFDILKNFDESLLNSTKTEFRIAAIQLLNTKAFSEFDLSQIQKKTHFLDFLEAEIKRSIETYIKYFIQRKED